MAYVYLVWQQNTSFFKIGHTRNLQERLASLNVGCPGVIELIATIETDKPYRLEKRLHRENQKFRTKGEWFSVHPLFIPNLLGQFNLCAGLVKLESRPQKLMDIVASDVTEDDIKALVKNRNMQLKHSSIPVRIQKRGKRLMLVATLPPKPTSTKTKRHQQRISLKAPLSPQGVELAFNEARTLGYEIVHKLFRWEDWADTGAG